MERNFPWYLLKEYFDVKFNWILKKTTEEIIKTFNLKVKDKGATATTTLNRFPKKTYLSRGGNLDGQKFDTCGWLIGELGVFRHFQTTMPKNQHSGETARWKTQSRPSIVIFNVTHLVLFRLSNCNSLCL